MIISVEKVNESYIKYCQRENKSSQDVESIEPFFQWYCQKKGFTTFKRIDGRKFEFSNRQPIKNN